MGWPRGVRVIEQQKPETLNQTKNFFQWIIASKDKWTKEYTVCIFSCLFVFSRKKEKRCRVKSLGRWEVLGRDDREESIIRIHFTKIIILNLKVKLIFFLKKRLQIPYFQRYFQECARDRLTLSFLVNTLTSV